MRSLSLVLYALLLTANVAVADVATTPQDTTRHISRTYHDPIDYNAVRYELMRASRKSFLQRVVETLTRPLVDDTRIKLDASVGVGYTQETNLSVVLGATAQYHPANYTTLSTASLTAMVSVNGFFRIEANGVHRPNAAHRLMYAVGGGSMPTRFWGVGYDAANKNIRGKYVERDASAVLGYMHNVYDNVWLGGGLDIQYNHAADADSLATTYLSEAEQELRSAFTTGVTLRAEYDTRDNTHTTTRGLYLSLYGQVRPRFLGNLSHALWHWGFEANYFQPLWQGGVMAVDIYGDIWSKHTPWVYWPSVGGSSRMRGYYYGRYRDRNMITTQLELRQNIYGPLGVCGWVGAGNIFADRFNWAHTLPNYGLGLRLALEGRTVLRVDYGWGKHSNGLIINVNEAF